VNRSASGALTAALGLAGVALTGLASGGGAAPYGLGRTVDGGPEPDAGAGATGADAGPGDDELGPAATADAAPPTSPAVTAEDEDHGVVDEEPPPELYVAELRPGGRLFGGFEFGLGRYDPVCTDCSSEGGLALGLELGVQLGPRLGLSLDAWSVLHLRPVDDEDGVQLLGHSQATVAAKVWLTPSHWVRAGAGVGGFHVHGGDGFRALGPALAVAFGHELLHRPWRGVDLVVRAGGSWVDDAGERVLIYSLGGLVGFHWN
jgi:hypothetical protein